MSNLYDYLVNTVKRSKLQNPAVIFDIDGTLIRYDKTPIKPVVKFYHYCLKKGIPIFIVTARPGTEYNKDYTIDELHKNNIQGWEGMSFYDNSFNNWGIAESPLRYLTSTIYPGSIYRYKYNARKNIYENGFNTILSIGDQEFDVGEYGGVSVLLHDKV